MVVTNINIDPHREDYVRDDIWMYRNDFHGVIKVKVAGQGQDHRIL